MNNLPPFDYTTKMDLDAYRQANWDAFKKVYRNQFIRLSIISVVLLLLPSLLPKILPAALFFIITIFLTVTFLFLNQKKLIDKACSDFADKDFTTTLAESEFTIRNPVSGTLRTYPYNSLIPFAEGDDYYMLKVDHELLYIGKAGLRSANALEFFESKLNNPLKL